MSTAADIIANNRPSGSSSRPARARSGYYRPKVLDFKVTSGTAATGRQWTRLDWEFEVTGPNMADPNSQVNTKVRHQFWIPDGVWKLDPKSATKEIKKDKNGKPMTVLPDMTAMMIAAGADDGTKDEPLVSKFRTLDGIVEGVELGDATIEEIWPQLVDYFITVMKFYNKKGYVYAGGVKYLSGDGGKPMIKNAKGKDVYDNPEIKEFLTPSAFEKLEGGYPNGPYDKTYYQAIASKSEGDAGSESGSANAATGPRQAAPAAARPAIPGRPPARR